MSWWSVPELSSGLRPVLADNEKEIFLQNNVGLYDGWVKEAA